MLSGKFQGVISAATPIGSRNVSSDAVAVDRDRLAEELVDGAGVVAHHGGARCRRTSARRRSPFPCRASRAGRARRRAPRAGRPSGRAPSPAGSASARPSPRTRAPRRGTARSASSAPASATVRNTSPVAGLIESNVRPSAAATRSPSISSPSTAVVLSGSPTCRGRRASLDERRGRAARRRPGSSSGCQSTPRQNGCSGSSTASIWTVGRARGDDEPVPEPLRRPGGAPSAPTTVSPSRNAALRAGLGLDRVPSEHARPRPVRREVGRVGEVLDQVAAGGDVEQLHAPADAEHRQPAPACLEQQRELEGVAPLLLLAGLGVRLRRRRTGRRRGRGRRSGAARRSRRAPRRARRAPSGVGGSTSGRPPASRTPSM